MIIDTTNVFFTEQIRNVFGAGKYQLRYKDEVLQEVKSECLQWELFNNYNYIRELASPITIGNEFRPQVDNIRIVYD